MPNRTPFPCAFTRTNFQQPLGFSIESTNPTYSHRLPIGRSYESSVLCPFDTTHFGFSFHSSNLELAISIAKLRFAIRHAKLKPPYIFSHNNRSNERPFDFTSNGLP
jgi:hypothetical protein